MVGFTISIYGQQHAFRKKLFFGVAFNNEEIVDSSHYIFNLAKLYELEDDSIRLKKQLVRPSREASKFDKIYYWSSIPAVPSNKTMVNYKKNKSNIVKKQQLSYAANSYFATDPILKSPFTPIWSPIRRGVQYLDEKVGLHINAIVLTYIGFSPDVIEGKPDGSGFIGGDVYSNWLIASSENWGVTNITFELGYKQNIFNENPDLGNSVGSNITSNVTTGNSAPIIGDFYITQGVLANKLLISMGRLTPWYFYAYNTFTDDELTRSFNSLLNGGTYLPKGGGNSTKPGFAVQYLINTHFYFNFVFTNPGGADASFDFKVYNPDFHFLASEIGYVYTLKNQLEGRISFGIHHGLRKNMEGQKDYNGFGFNILLQQELTPKGYTPYIGFYIQAGFSDPTIANVKQQYSMGMNIDHFIHRRNDGLSLGIGLTDPSESGFRREFFVDMYYRLQFTESAHLTLDVQLFINPTNPEQPKDFATIYSLRYLFSI